MTSFIDLFADHRWSEGDIVNRTEAMVREHFTVAAERILARKVMGAGMGYALTAEEQAELAQFQAVTLAAQQAGIEARADMALLEGARAVEVAQTRLARAPVTPVTAEVAEGEWALINAIEVAADDAERAAAQAALDAAPQEVADLVAARAARRAQLEIADEVQPVDPEADPANPGAPGDDGEPGATP